MKQLFLAPIIFMTLSLGAQSTAFAQVRTQWSPPTGAATSYRGCHHNDKVECALVLARKLSNELYFTVDYDRYGRVFLPILTKAAIAEDTLADLGPYSAETRAVIMEFIRTIKMNENEINSLLSTPAQFDIARSLLSVVRVVEKEIR